MDNLKDFEVLGMTPKKEKLTAEQIAKVKSLGCLRDKRFDDVFNVRVITGNGKITSEQHKIIAEAAEIFGSSEISLTSRMTLEIQGVPYDRIPALVMYLKERGLQTGGTGAKVRPVVSCKGTTCQFGLIDTYSLSKKIHERFFVGYGDVALPHKFKIAVGGCPNNCVKPDLNDFGVIGQRIFTPNEEKCRGCKKCVIQMNCPMKAPSLVDGKISKYYTENFRVDQQFVMDGDITVGKYIENTAKALGADVKLTSFVRFEKGEGIEKRVDDFAAEVAGMVK